MAVAGGDAPGSDLLGLGPSRAGRVVYFAGEDPLPILEYRIHAIGKHLPCQVHPVIGVVCGRGRNPTLRLWPTIFSGKIDVFPGDRRSRLISSMTSVAPA